METELTLEEIPFDDMGGGLDPRAAQFTASVSQQEEMMRVAAYLELLKKLGYYKGKIDGIWGRLTENAYEQYSRDSKGDGHQTVVKSGDTLSKIANKYGVSVLLIAAINPLITNINRILVGLVINLPSFIRRSSLKSNTANTRPSKVASAADNTPSKQSLLKQSLKPLEKTTATNADQNRQNAPHLKKDYSGLRLMLATTPRSILDGRGFFSDFSRLSNIPPRISDKWKPGMPLTGGYTPF